MVCIISLPVRKVNFVFHPLGNHSTYIIICDEFVPCKRPSGRCYRHGQILQVVFGFAACSRPVACKFARLLHRLVIYASRPMIEWLHLYSRTTKIASVEWLGFCKVHLGSAWQFATACWVVQDVQPFLEIPCLAFPLVKLHLRSFNTEEDARQCGLQMFRLQAKYEEAAHQSR